MRAIRVEAPGGPEALTLHELPEPTPGAGQARVRVEAAGVNFIDTCPAERPHRAARRASHSQRSRPHTC
jgi:NADPH:quinone reductase-like Zn-dependent oxidoreductase